MHKSFIVITVLLTICILAACTSNIPEIQRLPLEPPPSEQTEHVTVTAPQLSPEEQLAQLQQLLTEQEVVPKLGRGDVLNVSVYDEFDLSIKGIPIRPDGQISFPLIGDIQAEGLTVAELNKSLTEGLSKFILAPKVSIIVQQFNSQKFTIFGEVVSPGVYPLNTDVSITEALARAGGLNKGQFRATSVELADLAHAFIARNREILPVDFVRLIRQGDLRYDISLRSGDYIYIPSGLSKEVYILGEVNKPMLFAFREDMPMSRTLAQAEGFTPNADLQRIHVLRGSLHNPTVLIINFKEVLAGNALEIPLKPGDIIYVPPTGLTTFSRTIGKIVPTVQALQLGIILSKTVED